MIKRSVLAMLACLPGCGNTPPPQVAQAFAVACTIDGSIVPLAEPVVASLGTGGAAAADVDAVLVHPAVVAACQAVDGTPARVVAIVTPSPAPASGNPTPAN